MENWPGKGRRIRREPTDVPTHGSKQPLQGNSQYLGGWNNPQVQRSISEGTPTLHRSTQYCNSTNLQQYTTMLQGSTQYQAGGNGTQVQGCTSVGTRMLQGRTQHQAGVNSTQVPRYDSESTQMLQQCIQRGLGGNNPQVIGPIHAGTRANVNLASQGRGAAAFDMGTKGNAGKGNRKFNFAFVQHNHYYYAAEKLSKTRRNQLGN